MANSYENEVNELVDGIMKVAEETAAASGMEKEAGIFNRKKKSEVAANKAKADAMFSGQGSDDSASDPRGKVQKKWKRIKAKFFKKANDNTEEMIEKIAAAAGTEVDMLLDYIEKIAAEEDLDGQDIVDTLYEEIEEEPEVEEEDAYEDDEDDEDEDDEDGEEVEASMINDAMEKIAAVTGMDEETIADYIISVAAENEVDELEVLAAMEDEADAELEKEAGVKDKIKAGGRKVYEAIDGLDNRLGNKLYGEETYQPAKSNIKRMGALAKSLKKGEGSLEEYKDSVGKYKEFNDLTHDKGRKFSRIPSAIGGAVMGGLVGHESGHKGGALLGAAAGGAGMAGLSELSGLANKRSARKGADAGSRYVEKKYNRAVAKREAAEKKAFEVMVDEAIEKVASAANVDVYDVLDYVEKVAAENRLDEIEVLAELEKEAFEALVDEAIEKVASVAGVSGEDVVDYVEKVAAENDLDEIEILAELEKEAGMKPGFARNVRDTVTKGKLNAELFGATHKKGLKIGGGVAAAAGLAGAGYAGYKHVQKKKSQAEAEKEAFEVMVDEAIEKVAFVAGVSGEDVVDYVEKLAYENDVDEIEVLAELEKEAFDVKRTAGNVFVGRKNLDNFAAKKNMYEGMKSQRGLGVTNDAFKASRKDFAKAGLGVAKRPAAIGAGLAAAGTGAYLLNKRRKRQAEKAAE